MPIGKIIELKNNYGIIDTSAFKVQHEWIPFKIENYMLEERNGKQYIKYTKEVEFTLSLSQGMRDRDIKEELDIALIPANVASVLYHKTEGGISVIDINTLGVLYMVSGDESIHTNAGLCASLYYEGNGLTDADVTLEYKSEATEVAAVLSEHPDAVGLLPQPFVTVASMQNQALNVVMDLNEQWTALQGEDGSRMVTGVTVVRNAFLEENEESLKIFLKDHRESAEAINADVQKGTELAVAAGIIAKEPIAEQAIPKCNITYIDGTEMKQALSGYLSVLFEQDPKSVGGALPEDEFYYVP